MSSVDLSPNLIKVRQFYSLMLKNPPVNSTALINPNLQFHASHMSTATSLTHTQTGTMA
jgi:hypothetical protein